MIVEKTSSNISGSSLKLKLGKCNSVFHVIDTIPNESYLFDLHNFPEYRSSIFGDIRSLVSGNIKGDVTTINQYKVAIKKRTYLGNTSYVAPTKRNIVNISSYKALFNNIFSDLPGTFAYNDNIYYSGRGILAVEENNKIRILVCVTIYDKYVEYYGLCKSLCILPEDKIFNVRVSTELLSSKSIEYKGLRTSFKRTLNEFLKYNIWQEDPQFIVKDYILPNFKTLTDQKSYINEIKTLYSNTINVEKTLTLAGINLVY